MMSAYFPSSFSQDFFLPFPLQKKHKKDRGKITSYFCYFYFLFSAIFHQFLPRVFFLSMPVMRYTHVYADTHLWNINNRCLLLISFRSAFAIPPQCICCRGINVCVRLFSHPHQIKCVLLACFSTCTSTNSSFLFSYISLCKCITFLFISLFIHLLLLFTVLLFRLFI